MRFCLEQCVGISRRTSIYIYFSPSVSQQSSTNRNSSTDTNRNSRRRCVRWWGGAMGACIYVNAARWNMRVCISLALWICILWTERISFIFLPRLSCNFLSTKKKAEKGENSRAQLCGNTLKATACRKFVIIIRTTDNPNRNELFSSENSWSLLLNSWSWMENMLNPSDLSSLGFCLMEH